MIMYMYTSMMVFGNKPAKMVDDMHQSFYMLPLVFICLASMGVLFCKAAIPLLFTIATGRSI